MNTDARFLDFYEASRDLPVYVILGVQGSGTNLLRRFLVSAFNFSVLQDHALIFGIAARLGQSAGPTEVASQFAALRAEMFPSRLSQKFRTPKVKPRVSEPFRDVHKVFDPSLIRSSADFARFFYAYRAFSLGTSLMAIKSDDLWEHIDAIDDVIPNRHVILLTRDFRDNLLSVAGKNFGPIEPVCAAEYVKERFRHYDSEYRRSGSRGYHIQYESMLNAPRQFLLDFADRFKLPFVKDPDDVVAEIALRPAKVGKWRQLAPQQLAWCEAILRDELTAYGYAPDTVETRLPDAWTRLAAHTRDVWKRMPQKLHHIGQRLTH